MFALFQAYGPDQFHTVSAWIYVGCSKEDVKLLAWSHNVDNEYWKNMTTIDCILTIHLMWMSEFKGKKVWDGEFWMKCAKEILLEGHDGDRRAIQRHNALFQCTFRDESLWNLQEMIFSMWMRQELKG
ncbi:hypothetical protein R1flu_027754 [Riccia fluitans]|uniref:Uncharacterized protein n=1 Tax=Riccia fluitans TaxID=41844 RepID=A0ABD1XMJ6_9MARC